MNRLWSLFLVPVVVSACASEVITHFPRTDVGPDTGADLGVDTGANIDAGVGVLVGRPCESDLDCDETGWQCANRELLNSFSVGPEINLPGGMCTRLFCTSDEDCGEGGTCFDASALGAPVQICFASCERLTDCRWEENWGCFPLSELEEGAEGGACISASLEVAILCDDGSCDEEAQ